MSLYMCGMCHTNVATFASEAGRYCSSCNSIMEVRDDTLDDRLTAMQEKIDRQEELLAQARSLLAGCLSPILATSAWRIEKWIKEVDEALKP